IWGTRLQRRWKELGLDDCLRISNLSNCKLLCYNFEQYNSEADRPLTKKKYKKEGILKKYSTIIVGSPKKDSEPEENLEFRKQKEIGTAVKRRAIAIHHTKVLQSHLDNKNNKPENDKAEKKNSQTDWLRNKQIIVYNRAEIDDYLSDTFEQIL
ncbi:14452_t:CDS:2, partial [Gigaspora margarita]